MIYIFDLDGTLIDSTYRHGYLMMKLLREEGFEVDLGFQKKYLDFKRTGMNSETILEKVMKIEKRISEKIVNRWVQEIESDDMLQLDSLYTDSLVTLKKINREFVVFLSNRKRKEAAIDELKRLKIYEYAKRIYIESHKMGIEGKVQCIKEIMLYDSQKVTMIGDTEIDYEAAQRTGVQYYLVNRGFRNRKYWELKGIETYNDLLSLK